MGDPFCDGEPLQCERGHPISGHWMGILSGIHSTERTAPAAHPYERVLGEVSCSWSHCFLHLIDSLYIACPSLRQIIKTVTRGGRPPLPLPAPGAGGAGFPDLGAYVDLIQRCWAQDPTVRPDFEEITNLLRSAGKRMGVEGELFRRAVGTGTL